MRRTCWSGGTPCQAFSVAGNRKSLDDDRGQLTLKYVELLNEIDKQRPNNECIAVWENVPGVLSTDDNAFGCFLGELAGSGCELQPTTEPKPKRGKSTKFWKWSDKLGDHRPKWSNAGCVSGPQRSIAWRVIDAQYFGVAQRRRRVFLVASARNDFDPGKVLFEFEGLRRDIKPSREAQEEVIASTGIGAHWDNIRYPHPTLNQSNNTGGIGSSNQELFSQRGSGIVPAQDPAYCLQTTCNDYSRADGFNMVVHGTQDPCVQSGLAFTLGRNNGGENVVLPINGRKIRCNQNKDNGLGIGDQNDPMFTMTTDSRHAVYSETSRTLLGKPNDSLDESLQSYVIKPRVRRLLPVEGERLQGFPDGHTLVPHNGKMTTDGNRYKAIGNSKAVPCIQWVGIRILMEYFKLWQV